jgi:hypothetical protein
VARRGRSLPGRESPTAKWWTVGWLVRCRRLLAQVAALALLPLSLAHAMLSGDLSSSRCWRSFSFELGRPRGPGSSWERSRSRRASAPEATATTPWSRGSSSKGGAIAAGVLLIFSRRIEPGRAQWGVMLGPAAGARLRDFGRGDQGAERRSRKPARGAPQPLDCPRRHGGGCPSLASAPEPAGRRRRGRDRCALRREHVHDRRGVVVFGDPFGDDFLVVGRGSRRSSSCSWPRR